MENNTGIICKVWVAAFIFLIFSQCIVCKSTTVATNLVTTSSTTKSTQQPETTTEISGETTQNAYTVTTGGTTQTVTAKSQKTNASQVTTATNPSKTEMTTTTLKTPASIDITTSAIFTAMTTTTPQQTTNVKSTTLPAKTTEAAASVTTASATPSLTTTESTTIKSSTPMSFLVEEDTTLVQITSSVPPTTTTATATGSTEYSQPTSSESPTTRTTTETKTTAYSQPTETSIISTFEQSTSPSNIKQIQPENTSATENAVNENKLSSSNIVKFVASTSTTNTPSTSIPTTTKPPVSVVKTCKQESNCKLPSCFCPTFEHFLGNDKIPQIVYFGFDDELIGSYQQYIDTLFNENRKNPNGCPITMTLYVSHATTDYKLVKRYYEKGNEIASHSVTHKFIKTRKSILEEAKKQKENIVTQASIPAEKVTGWRSPYLEPAGDDQVEVLQSLGYEYDISHTYIPPGVPTYPTEDPWPFTLDYSGWPFICQILTCPKNMHKTFWEVPINVLANLNQDNLCAYTDSCQLTHEDDVFNYVWNNFKVNYNGNRAPFGLHLHARWFQAPHNLKGIDKFIKKLLQNKDVYIVSVQKMLEWMRNPKDISEVQTFAPWTCSESLNITTSTSVTSTENQQTTTAMTPQTSPPKSVSVIPSCQQGINCKLPSCFCPTFTHTMNSRDIPQIVYFGFDDEVKLSYKTYYDSLFSSNRQNPNGCPITMTLFVSHLDTNYDLVKYYYDKGNEIGSHSVTHSFIRTRAAVLEEARNQRNNINISAGIPAERIIGWRSPYLEPAGDDQVDVLQSLGYKYDISHTYIPLGRPTSVTTDPWPFTLDYSGWPFICQIGKCPKSIHKGFWEVPINVLSDLHKTNLCAFVDSCTNPPNNETEIYKYLLDNFELNYNSNRAPFGLHLHARWFSSQHNLKGVDMFIKELLKRKHVYIISIQKMLEWMQNPVPITEAVKFKPWQCNLK